MVQNMIDNNVLKSNTRVILAFASFNFDSTEYIPGFSMSLDSVKSFCSLVHNAGSKVSLSVGGATYPFAGSDLYLKPGFLASNINTVLTNCGFDGVDFDIEDSYMNVPSDFAEKAGSLINSLRSLNSGLYISLTTPCQAWAKGMYQQTLLNLTIGNINVWQPMEYDLWISPENNYSKQIVSDMLFYITNWQVAPNKIVMGLMPGADDMGHVLSLQDALNLTAFAMTYKLAGVMTWNANLDSTGIGNNSPYAFAKGIQTMFVSSYISVYKNSRSCCVVI
jgi:chitinase